MKGLHVVKPGNEPQVGQVKTFIIAGNRIKSKKAEEGGVSYTITSVSPKEDYTDSYGNVAFNIEVEPGEIGEGRTVPFKPSIPMTSPTSNRASGGGWDENRSNRIERQHSQEMALRYFALKANGEVPDHILLRKMIDWFQRDVGLLPVSQQAADNAAEDGGVY